MNPPYSPQRPDTDPRTLHQRQVLHVRLTSALIAWAQSQGYALTWGETYRLPAQAAANAASGAGILNSLHLQRLAVDFQLFDAQGNYLTDASAYQPLADYWLTLDLLCCAGYYFHSVDADHFAISYQGRM
jgi:hypothetical protein